MVFDESGFLKGFAYCRKKTSKFRRYIIRSKESSCTKWTLILRICLLPEKV